MLRFFLLLALALGCGGCWWKDDPEATPKPKPVPEKPKKPLTANEQILIDQHHRAVFNVQMRQCHDAYRPGAERTKCEAEAIAALRAVGQEP